MGVSQQQTAYHLEVQVAAVTFADLDAVPRRFESLAEGFKVSLVRPDHEAANSGQRLDRRTGGGAMAVVVEETDTG